MVRKLYFNQVIMQQQTTIYIQESQSTFRLYIIPNSEMKNLQFYRIEYCNGLNPFLASADYTLSQLYLQIGQKINNQNFILYYHYKPLVKQQHGQKKLKQIVDQQPMPQPSFIIYDIIDNEAVCPYIQRYSSGYAKAQKTKQETKQFSIGENGLIVFDNRQTSLLAASVNHATQDMDYSKKKKQIVDTFNKTVVQKQKNQKNLSVSLPRKVLSKLGIMKKNLTQKNMENTIQKIKDIKTKQDLVAHINRQYSDYDPKFASYLQAVYLKYGILNGYRLHYIQYKNIKEDGVIKYKFPKDAKIAIIGDFGTGLSDSFGLLKHAIIDKQADIILHLGDVYYAGTPSQYKNNIMEPLNMLRLQAAQRFRKDVLFYSIPGNHDYYTWGLPFLTFVANANEVKQITSNFIKKKKTDSTQEQPSKKQQSSYFCLRSEDSRWQFIGLDTAYHDSNPFNQINGVSLGPRLRQKQLDWFIDKMQHFPGSTILLTHHQLFSIHDRICGSMSQYKAFSCLNPLLSAQLFKYLPVISCWYWGHEHSIMFFDNDVMGVRKCRLLGNSSFHVFQKQGPYLRKKQFPSIPLIQQDQIYMDKYLPINPQSQKKNHDCYYNLSYALIDFSKQKVNQFCPDEYQSTLTVQYFCCPCYSQQDARKRHFAPYLMYQEQIQPRINSNIVTTEKILKNEHNVVGNIHEITDSTQVFIKTQIGLFADHGSRLTLSGKKYKFIIQKSSNIELSQQAGLKQQNSRKSLSDQNQHNQKKNQTDVQINSKQHQKQQQLSGKLLLDGDIISFKEVFESFNIKMKKKSKQEMRIQSSQHFRKSVSLNIEIKPDTKNYEVDILKNQPQLKQITSIDSSDDLQIKSKQQQIIDETAPEMINYHFFMGKKFQIKKSRILKDNSLHIKFGDAFSLREVSNNQFLTIQTGIYGGILKLQHHPKPNYNPTLFMFIADSKIKQKKANK